MKLPLSVNILGSIYAITYRKDDYFTYGNTCGQCMILENKIWIDGRVTQERQLKILIHEILEAINDDLELSLTHQTITCLETALYQVIKDNKLWPRGK